MRFLGRTRAATAHCASRVAIQEAVASPIAQPNALRTNASQMRCPVPRPPACRCRSAHEEHQLIRRGKLRVQELATAAASGESILCL
jgi:hypothetical protein